MSSMRNTRCAAALLLGLAMGARPVGAGDAPDPEAFERLDVAIRTGGVARLREALDAGTSPKAAKPTGLTALHVAAALNDLDCARLLLDRGADPNAINSASRQSPAGVAVWSERWSLARLLVERGANPETVLYPASAKGQVDLVRLCLAKGAAVRPKERGEVPQPPERDGRPMRGPVGRPKERGAWTPLHAAAQGGSVAVIDVLLEAGAEVDASDSDGWTPLTVAAREGRAEAVARLLSRGARPDGAGERSPVFLAVYGGHVDAARALADAGAKLDVFTAAGTGRAEELARILAKDPAAAKSKRAEGDTPLHYAARSGSAAAVTLLLAAGADLEARDRNKSRPFHLATTPEVADVFLAKGVSIDAVRVDRGDETLLALAARSGRTALALHLLERGARFPKSAKKDLVPASSPLHGAAAAGDLKVVRWLVEHGAEVDLFMQGSAKTPLRAAVERGADEVARWLVEHGANVNVLEAPEANILFDRMRVGPTVLGAAILADRSELALWLLDHGGSPTGPAGTGLPALHAAAARGALEVAKALLDRGASAKAYDEDGETPLHIAARQGHEAVVTLLLDHGADRAALSGDKRTAADLAAEARHFDLAQRLR